MSEEEEEIERLMRLLMAESIISGFPDILNYGERCVARNDYEWGYISTARVSDGKQPIETCVSHIAYWAKFSCQAVVEAYDTKEQALEGHKKWVVIMTADKLPETLIDVCNAKMGQLGKILDPDFGTKTLNPDWKKQHEQ
jgi:hypothetical protein